MLAANRAASGIFSGAANCSQVSRRALTLRRAMAKGPELAQQGHRVHPART